MAHDGLLDALEWYRNARTGQRGARRYPGLWLPPRRALQQDMPGVVALGQVRRRLLQVVRDARLGEDEGLVQRFYGLTGYPERLAPAVGEVTGRASLVGSVRGRRDRSRPVGERAVQQRLAAAVAGVPLPLRPPTPPPPVRPYKAVAPTSLLWFRLRLTTDLSDPEVASRALQEAVFLSVDEVPEHLPELRRALDVMLVRAPRWMAGDLLGWPDDGLPPARTPRVQAPWTGRALSSIAVHLWDLLNPRPSRPTPEGRAPAPALAGLTVVPARFADACLAPPQHLDLQDTVARFLRQDRLAPWAPDLTRVLLRAYRVQARDADQPPPLAHRLLSQAALANGAASLWDAVALARELLALPTTSRLALDTALLVVPVANTAGAHHVAMGLLRQVDQALDAHRPVTGPPLDPVYVVETRQQVALLRAGTVECHLDRYLPALLRADGASAVDRLVVAADDLAAESAAQLESLPQGWDTGGHGGDARASWMMQPVLRRMSISITAGSAARRRAGAAGPRSDAYDTLASDARGLLAQTPTSGDDRVRLHAQVRFARLDLTRALARHDPDEYRQVSALATDLLLTCAALGPDHVDGLAQHRFLDLDEVARDVIAFDGDTVPPGLATGPRATDGVETLRRRLA